MTSINEILMTFWNIQKVSSPAGRQNVNSAKLLWVSTLGGRQGIKNPKSGTMLPMMVADSTRQRANGRVNGNTAAAWEMVNGIEYLTGHLVAMIQIQNTAIASLFLTFHKPNPRMNALAGAPYTLLRTLWQRTIV